MVTIPDGEWELTCSAELFARIRDTREFAVLVTLGRVASAVKFGIEAHRYWSDVAESPLAERQRVSAMLYLAAVVHEAYELKTRLEQEASLDRQLAGVFDVLADERFDRQFNEDIHRIRNRAAFHFDIAVAQQALPEFPAESFAFITSEGRDPMNANYELTDMVYLGFMFGAPADVAKLTTRLTAFRPTLDTLLREFTKATDQYLFSRLSALGFVVVPRERGSFAADRRNAEPDAPTV